MSSQSKQSNDLPPIPDKRYFTIGEVSELCLVKPHVLRYWEQEFKQLQPSKRRGNRRYYKRADILLVREIRELLYFQGYTISGARIKLSQPRKESPDLKNSELTVGSKLSIEEVVARSIKELKEALELLRK